MKKNNSIRSILGILLLFVFFNTGYTQSSDSLTLKGYGKIIVTLGNFDNTQGQVLIALFDSSQSQSEIKSENFIHAFRQKTISLIGNRMNIVFDSIPYGIYAIEAVHDENKNGRYEYAKEDYAFSNHARVNYGAVRFKQAAFGLQQEELFINMQLENEHHSRVSDHYSNSTAFAPVFGYAPETSVLLGANIIRLFKFKGEDSITRTSFADVFAAGTFNKQIIVEQNYTVFSNREKYMFIGFTGFQYFPQYYYGIGKELPASNKELVKYNQFRFDHLALRKLYKQIFVGAGYRYMNISHVSSADSGLLSTSKVAGYNGSVSSGIQFAIASDNRNSIYNSSKGHLVRIKALLNEKWLGSSFYFQAYETDLRKFIQLSKKRRDVLAFQAYGYFSSGNVPWIEMGALGSDVIMRGYYSGRYRDNNYAAVQTEYRLPFNKQFGMVIFAGTGCVENNIKNFTFTDLKPNYGTGARMTLDRKERLNLRLDVGFGQKTSNVYFSVAEAF